MTGKEVRAHPGIEDGPLAATTTGHVLTTGYAGSNGTSPVLIDLRARGEAGAVDTCAGVVAPDALEVAGGLAVFHRTCEGDQSGTTYVVDVQAQRVLYTLPGHQGRGLAIFPDGTRFVRQSTRSPSPTDRSRRWRSWAVSTSRSRRRGVISCSSPSTRARSSSSSAAR